MRFSRLLFLAGLATAIPAALAAQRRLDLESFHSELRVSLDGSVEVTETIRPRFTGSWQGIYRDLSLEHNTAEGRIERLDVQLVSVTNEAGEPLEYEVEPGSWTTRFKVWVPGAEDATRTVVIKYLVRNTLRFFREGSEVGLLDELYWNATGNGWEVPIEAATARVILPDSVAATEWAGYTGTSGSTETAVEIRPEGNVVEFAATRVLGSYEGLTVAVGWPAGIVTRPPPPSKLLMAVKTWWSLILPILALWLAFSRWKKHGRDPARRAISVQYEPPPNLTPTEVGTLVDHKAQMRDLTAALVDLAVRGYIHIEKRTAKLGPFTRTDYNFHLKKPGTEWGSLRQHEQLYLEAIFRNALVYSSGLMPALLVRERAAEDEPPVSAGEGPTYATVALSSLTNRFYTSLPGIKKAVYQELIGDGYYQRDPSEAKARWVVLGVFTLIGSFIALVMSQMQYPVRNLGPVVLAISLFVCGIIFIVWGRFMPARTDKGARAQEAALGFKQFLAQVEEDRFRRMITSPEMFERYLPYAMAFKVEGKWARAFEDMFSEPPRWYSGYDGGAFRASVFMHDLGRMSSNASSAMSSSPRSSGSSSSGSSGGGSSGGGSGGGGGGGF